MCYVLGDHPPKQSILYRMRVHEGYIQAIGRPQLILGHHKGHHGPQCTGQ